MALATFDLDGSGPDPVRLIAAGNTLSIGTQTTIGVAYWDGSAWHAMGTLNGASALAAFDPDGAGPQPQSLFAARSNQIWRWSAGTWIAVSTADAIIDCLTTFDPDGEGPAPAMLVAGGHFTSIDGVNTPHIAQWNGTVWSSLASGADDLVQDITVSNAEGFTALYAVGTFSAVGGLPAAHVARWNGETWSSMGDGFGGLAWRVAAPDPDGPGPEPASILVSGNNAASRGVYRWTGSTWEPMGGAFSDQPYAFITVDLDGAGPSPSRIVAAGQFANTNTQAPGGEPVSHIAQWDGVAWRAVGPAVNHGIDGYPYTALSFDDGSGPKLYVAGGFALANGVTAKNIAAFNGSTWTPLGPGLPYEVFAMTVHDPDGEGPLPRELYVGGPQFVPLDFASVARWDGSSWTQLPSAANLSQVNALASFDSDGDGPLPAALYAGGDSYPPTDGLVRLDGDHWTPVSPVVFGAVHAMATFDADGPGSSPPMLIVGGHFLIPGTPIQDIAAWTGQAWQPLGNGPGGPIDALVEFDPDGPGPAPAVLVASGQFSGTVARWNGSNWSTLWTLPGTLTSVKALAVMDDDGAGPLLPALYIGGDFGATVFVSGVGVQHYSSIARYSGGQWSPLVDGGVGRYINAIAAVPGPTRPSLYLAGTFELAGGISSQHIGRWCPPQCYPNCDGSTSAPILNVLDFNCFLNRYTAGESYANCDGSTAPPVLNILDFNCFLNRFTAGCP